MARAFDINESSSNVTSDGTRRAEGWTETSAQPQDEFGGFTVESVKIFSNVMVMMGYPRSYGQIYGLLYGSPQPLSFAEIQEKLGLSKGSVSQGLKALKAFGAVVPLPTESHWGRCEVYRPETELKKLVGQYLQTTLEPQMKSGAERLSALEARLDHSDAQSPSRRILKRRAMKLRSWHKKSLGVLSFVSRLLGT